MRKEDLPDLMAFAVIAEERSFTRAAARLGLSGSALSHAIRLLEERLATRLLSRTTRSVAPTEAGRMLLERLAPALTDIEAGLEALAEDNGTPSGMVRINSHRSGALAHLAPKIAELRRNFPHVLLDLVLDEARVDIVEAGFDAGIRHGEHVSRDMVAVQIGPPYQSAIVATRDYLDKAEPVKVPADVAKHMCLAYRVPASGKVLPWGFQHKAQRLNVVVEPAFVADDMQVLIAAALNGGGLAYVLREDVADHLASDRLIEVLPEWAMPYGACYLYYPNRRQIRPAMRAVIETLRWKGPEGL